MALAIILYLPTYLDRAALVDCYEWIDESESERSLIMQASAARRTVEESSSPEMGRSQ
jgi:hypothetical protein